MASMVTGRSLSPIGKEIAGLLPVPSWIFQGSVYLPNHEAGSGRPVSTEAQDMRCYTNQHQFYAGVDLHARSMYTHILDANGKTVSRRTCPHSPKSFSML
jgi:hypothetical protein